MHLVPNTLGVACLADEVRTTDSCAALAASLVDADARGVPVTIVGGGSNLVLRSRLPGLVLLLRIRGVHVERLSRRRWRVTVGAGESWHAVVRATLGRGISGLENLILIPGAVGAAPVQNIGAYGRELADVVDAVTVFDRRRGEFETLSREQCGFGYRDSSFKRQPERIIVRVSMILGDRDTMTDYPDVRAELQRMGVAASASTVAEAVVRVRRRKLPDPDRVGNVGSFFKNPLLSSRQYDELRGRLDIAGHPLGDTVKVPAARLIDAAGWKGVRQDAVQVWPRQPLVLVNHGGATGTQVLDFAVRIRDDVLAKYAIALDLEPAVLGVD